MNSVVFLGELFLRTDAPAGRQVALREMCGALWTSPWFWSCFLRSTAVPSLSSAEWDLEGLRAGRSETTTLQSRQEVAECGLAGFLPGAPRRFLHTL